jgi:hypothetical protein
MSQETAEKEKTEETETVLTVKIIESKNQPLTREFMAVWMQYLGNYEVVDFYRKSKKEENEGCPCQRSW